MSDKSNVNRNVNKVVFGIVSIAIRCIVVIVVAFLLIQSGKKAYSFGRDVFLDEPMTTEDKVREITVTIPDGASAKEIGEILERKNLIKDASVFYVQSLCVDEGKRLKGGRYDLDTSMSAQDMMKIIGADDTKDSEE